MTESDAPSRESRFMLDRARGEALLARFVAARDGEEKQLKLVVVVAHPDDEAIGAGAMLRRYPTATVVHITDGGGVDDDTAHRRGFATRAAYAAARREEVVRALRIAGIPENQVLCLEIPDGDAGRRLPEIASLVYELLCDLDVDVVLTHPYEGGHTDHDAAAFGVHMAAGMMRRAQGDAPLVLELTSYHDDGGDRVRGEFLPADVPEAQFVLDEEDRTLKRRMFDAFTSQQEVVAPFPLDVERFRIAPRYIFTKPPHPGTLDYERRCVRLTGEEWRGMAEQALAMLRTRRERRRKPRD